MASIPPTMPPMATTRQLMPANPAKRIAGQQPMPQTTMPQTPVPQPAPATAGYEPPHANLGTTTTAPPAPANPMQGGVPAGGPAPPVVKPPTPAIPAAKPRGVQWGAEQRNANWLARRQALLQQHSAQVAQQRALQKLGGGGMPLPEGGPVPPSPAAPPVMT